MRFAYPHPGRRRQRGYMLLTVMLMAALILVALSVELPAISQQIRHDREEELIHRGAQYARAIKRYYKKFGAYPVRLEQLESANHMRFLRKRYKDPMTGEDFRLLHVGEVQVSLTPQNSLAGASTPGASTSAFGTPSSAQFTSSPTASQAARSQGADTQDGKTGTQSASSASSSSGFSGPKFGGGPIIGVASTSKKQSMHVFNKKDHYADWVFFYDPTFDRGQGLITGPYNGPPTWGGTQQLPGATAAGQMNPGQNQTSVTPGNNPASSSPTGNSPFGQQR